MPTRPSSAPVTASGSSPAFRLPDHITNRRFSTPTNFSHPFEPDFESSPFVIPNFNVLANTETYAKMSAAANKRASMTEAGTKFRPTSSIYSFEDQRYPYIYGRQSEDIVKPATSTGSVFQNNNSTSSKFMGRAITTTVSQDEAMNKADSQRRSIDVVDAASPGFSGARAMTALPSMSLQPGDVKTSIGTAGTNVAEEEGKAKKYKRGSIDRFLSRRSFTINLPFGRHRRSTLVENDSRKKHKSDLDVLDCFNGQMSTLDDDQHEATDAANAANIESGKRSLDPENAFLTPKTLPTTPDRAGDAKDKVRDNLVTPKSKTWSGKRTKRMAKALKVHKMEIEIIRLNGEVARVEAENQQLRAQAEGFKSEWYRTNDKLLQEEYNHWNTQCARSRDAIARSEVPHYARRLAESAAQRGTVSDMSMGQLLHCTHKGGYEAGDLSTDVSNIDALLAKDGDEELRSIAEMRNAFAGPSSGAGPRSSWMTEGTIRTGRDGVRESWVTEWMPEGHEGEEAAPAPEIYRTHTMEEALRAA